MSTPKSVRFLDSGLGIGLFMGVGAAVVALAVVAVTWVERAIFGCPPNVTEPI